MPSVGAAFPARFRDGGPRDAQEPETAPGSGAGRKKARCCILLQRSPPTPVCVHKLRSPRERRFRKTPLVFLRPVKCHRPGHIHHFAPKSDQVGFRAAEVQPTDHPISHIYHGRQQVLRAFGCERALSINKGRRPGIAAL
ncbi:uncharacterized [Tachysurus ichikawai]